MNELLGSVELPPIPGEFGSRNGYAYTNVKLPQPVTWTLGFSYDHFEDLPVEVNKVSPKFGVIWDVTSNLSFEPLHSNG